MGILVTATQLGLYGVLRNPDDQFEIADEAAFSDRWMKRVEPVDPNQPPIQVPVLETQNHEVPADDEFMQKAKGKKK